MVRWYKEKNVVFKLKNTTYEEDVAIWKEWSHRKDPDIDFEQYFPGRVVDFPLKQGDKIEDINGNVKMVEDCRYLKRKKFKELFPKLSLTVKYIRVILIGGLEYNYRFSKTSNDRIKDFIQLNNGKIPPTYLKQTYYPNESPMKMYQIKPISDEEANRWKKEKLDASIEDTGTSKSPSSKSPSPDEEISVPGVDNTTEFERNFVDKMKSLPDKFSQKKFCKAWVATVAKYGKIEEYTQKNQKVEERGKELYRKYCN